MVQSADTESTRKAIKVWMRDVMLAKNWSASEWARRAGTSPTNITRFLSPTSDIMPSSSTISKLSRVAGSQPKLNALADLNPTSAWQVPCISAQMLAAYTPDHAWEMLMQPSSALQFISVDGPLTGPAFVSDVPSTAMIGRGIAPGDRILVEQVKRANLEPGHVVLFYHEDKPKIGEWQGQFILFYPGAPSDAAFAPVRSSEVELYGRVRRVIREL